MKVRRRKYQDTHPWIDFKLDLTKFDYKLWLMLGECQSKLEHIAGIPLMPEVADEFYRVSLIKGAKSTTAIEGNTLSEEEVGAILDDKSPMPDSRKYQEIEVRNIIDACNVIVRDVMSSNDVALTPEIVKEYNRKVLANLEVRDGATAGEISEHNVVVGRYLGAPREDCDFLLSELCKYLNQSFQSLGELTTGMAILKAIFAHLYLAWIHAFGDGNGRTARLIELQILCASGVPAAAAHLMSNHYNLTRDRYYYFLDRASKDRANGVMAFLYYAVEGFRDGLREQIDKLKEFQRKAIWENYVHQKFRNRNSATDIRRRHLVLDVTVAGKSFTVQELKTVTPRMALHYAGKSDRTVARDVDELVHMELLKSQMKSLIDPIRYYANTASIGAFISPRKRLQHDPANTTG